MTPPTFYKVITSSPQWQEWIKYNVEHPELSFDVYACMELDWCSEKHFQAFIEFCKKT